MPKNLNAILLPVLLLGLLAAAVPEAARAFHFPWDQGHDTFQPDPDDDDTDPEDDGPNECGSPVQVSSGNFVFSVQLFSMIGLGPDVDLTLTYNSRDMRQGPFGNGWRHAYEQRVIQASDGVQVTAVCSQGSGRRERYTRTSSGTFLTPAHLRNQLLRSSSSGGNFEIREKDGTVRRFADDGRLIEIEDRNGNVVFLEYDSTGFLTFIVDAPGRVIELTKDSSGRVASLQDPAGRLFTFAYDADGNLIAFSNPLGAVTLFEYDSKSNLTAVVDALDNTQMALTYDSDQRVSTLTQRAEAWTFNYQPSQNKTTKTDSQGNVWTYRYNDTGNITEVTDPLGRVEKIFYDADFNVTSSVSPAGGRTSLTYDADGSPLTHTDPLGRTRRMTYEPTFNQIASIRNAANQVTTFDYDARGNLIRSINALGQTTSYEYDVLGQMTKVTDPLGNASTITYDSFGNMIEVKDALGNRSAATYDLLGKVTSNTDPKGRVVQFEYDDADRLLRTVAADGGETEYAYDVVGNLLSLETTNGSRTTYQYDVFNRLIRVTNPLGQSTVFSYDSHDNPVQSTDPRGQTVVMAYDALDRLVSKQKPDGTSSFTYDVAGNLLVASDDDSSVSFTYDAVNRMTSAVTAAGVAQPAATILYEYAGENARSRMIDPAGGVTVYSYDAISRLSQLTDPSGNDYTFTYDAFDRRTAMTQGAGLSTEYSYDGGHRLVGLAKRGGPTDLVFSYSYDGVSNRLGTVDGAGSHTYTFDVQNRVLSALHPSGTESYAYDAVGNRTASHLSSGYSYDAANRLTADDVFDYVYDANGNLTRKTERATGSVTQLTYDSENQLIRVDDPAGGFVELRYDALGRRITKKTPMREVQYVYDEQDVLMEYEGGAVVARYTHGPDIDEVLGVERGGVFAFFECDALGSIRRVVDAGGVELASYIYDSYGRIIAESGSSFGPYRFQGREFDEESGLYYFRARYYDPAVGRFISEDPLGFTAGPNFYAFAENNPVNLTDPFGLEVGFWESLIPVWGSGKQAYEDFSCGRWGWGLLNTALAVSDVFLVKALVTGVAKGVFKAGLKRGMSRANPAFPRGVEWVERSHWIPRRHLPDFLKDAGWNMKPMWGTDHALADPFRYRFMPRWWKAQNPLPNGLTRQLNRIPNGVQGAGAGAAYGGGRAANNARDKDCGCD